ncbi:hypothetical protein R3W88_008580 [Solanum pinnatisectum]|uniref:Uncharacterized protein n=1 Tax=Solanum pinnatisectum TaxID=50273 RepID=A0AAV9M8V5_9SOLN|nr:hypothetical protein R3W88_008580 [Solanum pinnatisectum]
MVLTLVRKLYTPVKGTTTGNSFVALEQEVNEGGQQTPYELLETRDQAQEKEGDTEQSHGITNTSNNKQTESTKDWIKQAFGDQQYQIAIQHCTNSTTENYKCKTVDKDEQAVATEEVVNNKVRLVPAQDEDISKADKGRANDSINKYEGDKHDMELIRHQQHQSDILQASYQEPLAVASWEDSNIANRRW